MPVYQSETIPLHSIMSFEECAANIGVYRQRAIQAINSIQQLRGELFYLDMTLISSCFAETMQLVANYLHQIYQDGMVIGGRLICTVCRVSENALINPFSDYGNYWGSM